jgi:hypothetical protein
VDYLKLAPGSISGTGGAVTISIKVSSEGEELAPETEYYYFTSEATNASGTTQGETQIFRTPPHGPPPDPPVNVVAPDVLGTPEPGKNLFCRHGLWENSPSGYTYVWLRDGSIVPEGDVRIVPDPDGRSLEVQPEDRGHEFSCEVSAGNWGGSGLALSNSVQVPELPLAPNNVEPPLLAGSTEVGATLACSQGTWENDPTGYEYAWLRDGGLVASGDSSDLVVSAADRGHVLACAVTASNDGGASQSTSNDVTVPVQIQPSAEPPPLVSVLPVAPPALQAISPKKCRRVGHVSHRGGKGRVALRQAGRSCHPGHGKVR